MLVLISSFINFYLFVVAVAIMICGGTCGSGLMIVTATRYLAKEKHSKYYGYNSACVGLSGAVGILAVGFITTYVGWRALFLLPFLSLITIPYIKKYIPDEKGNKKDKLDIIGLALLSLFTVCISLFFSISSLVILVVEFYGQKIKISNEFIVDTRTSNEIMKNLTKKIDSIIFSGTQDCLVTPETCKTAAARLDARLVTLEGADHGYGFFENRNMDYVNKIVNDTVDFFSEKL